MREFKYFYNQRGFYDLRSVAKAAGVNYNSLFSRLDKGYSIEDAVEAIRKSTKAKEETLATANKLLGVRASSLSELRTYLDENDYPYNQAYLKSTTKRLRFIQVLTESGYEKLLRQVGQFEFQGCSYNGFSEIAFKNNFYLGDLFRGVFEYNGDMKSLMSFLHSGGTYAVIDTITYDGVEYDSLGQLARKLGISAPSIDIRVRKGMSIERAIRNSLESKNKIVVRKNQYPIEVNGVTFRGNGDVKKYFVLSDYALEKYVYHLPTVREGIERLFNRRCYKKLVKEFGWLEQYYGIDMPTITKLAKDYKDLGKVVSYLDSIRFELNGKYYVALKCQVDNLGFSKELPLDRFQRALRITTPGDSRQKVVARYVQKYLEQKDSSQLCLSDSTI